VMNGVLGASEGEAPVMPLDNSGGDPETEPGSVEFLCGVEGLEDAVANSGRSLERSR
jgi:hypothetical protein